MNFMDLASKYIHDHNNPLVKVEVFGYKQFLSTLTKEQEKLKEKCLADIESKLRRDRVDRRLARNVAEWLPDQNVAKIIRRSGSALSNLGTCNNNARFLDAKETMVLLETNKLELRHRDIPVSIEEAYMSVITSNCLLKQYLVYKKAFLQGYKLKKYETSELGTKRKLCDKSDDGTIAKVPKLESSEEKEDFGGVFRELRCKGPQVFQSNNECSLKPDYKMSSEKTERLNLFIINLQNFHSKYAHKRGLNICGSFKGDDACFFRLIDANIPCL